ncbi:AAA family ATPase [Acinetobacter baumannii]|uniref:AAA family ATPase n=1 Tax=Acinetobacter baumannii TaxID=470 RepID=UPI0030BC7E4B
MTTKYISLLQLKGGAGKTTIAFNLIGYFLSKNKKVLGVDADMQQGTLYAWSNLFKHPKFECVGVNTLEELINVLREAQEKYDIVITDLPPRLADIARSSLVFSDLVLVPVPISSADVWAAMDLTKLIEAAKAESNTAKIRVVWNMFKSTKRKIESKEEIKQLLGHDEVKQHLSDYVAYSDVLGLGTWVGDHNHEKAKAEFLAFAKEVEKLIK